MPASSPMAGSSSVANGRLHARFPARRSTLIARSESLGDRFKEFMRATSFENWAPRSSRAWRLRQYPSEGEQLQNDKGALGSNGACVGQEPVSGLTQAQFADEEQFASSLEERVRRLSQDATSVTSTRLQGGQAGGRADVGGAGLASFTDSDDSAISDSLSGRLQAFGRSGSMDDALVAATAAITPADPEAPLTGEELIQLVQAKYGKRYDLTIARRAFAGKDFVSLNIMWVHSEQRSFPMTPRQFSDKMDGICLYLNAWNKQMQVRTFMKQKPKGSIGLPPRPIVGIAVPLQLDLPQAVIQEWLGDRLG